MTWFGRPLRGLRLFSKDVTAIAHLLVPAEIFGDPSRRARFPRPRSGANSRRRSSMRRAVMGSLVVGAVVSLLVKMAWAQARDLDATLMIWPTRGRTIR
jgi:hypothetical protein